jgi:hypothetical protein
LGRGTVGDTKTMNFANLLNEKFHKGFRFSPEGYKEIFVNPTTSEINEVVRSSYRSEARLGVQDKPKGDMYVWDSEITHERMLKILRFDFGFSYRPVNDFIESTHYTFWKKFKNKKPFLKRLKKMFPRAKKISIWSPDETIEIAL